MPVSHPFNRPIVAQIMMSQGCATALDIGVGYGEVGAYLIRRRPRLQLDGIEIWSAYANPKWNCYRRLWLGDFRYLAIPPIYDAILALDVIEHLPKTAGVEQINRLRKLSRQVFILSLPIVDYPQGAWGGNPYEVHRSHWRVADVTALGLRLVAQNNIIGVFA